MVSNENQTLLDNLIKAKEAEYVGKMNADEKKRTEKELYDYKYSMEHELPKEIKTLKETHVWFLNEKYPQSDFTDKEGVEYKKINRGNITSLNFNYPYGSYSNILWTNGDLDLSDFTGLTKLIIGGGVNKLDISKCVNLEELAINGYNNLADKTLAFLAPLTKLKKLNLGVFNYYTGFSGYPTGNDRIKSDADNLETGKFTGTLADFKLLVDLEELNIAGNLGITASAFEKKIITVPNGKPTEFNLPKVGDLPRKTMTDGVVDMKSKGLIFEKFLFDGTRIDRFKKEEFDTSAKKWVVKEDTAALTREQFYTT